MSDPPTLIVDGDPADWLPCDCDDCDREEFSPPHPPRDTVRVDGPLPTVTYVHELPGHHAKEMRTRPLRVGDRVKLSTECVTCPFDHGDLPSLRCPDCGGTGFVPFATATVAKILDPEYKARHGLSDVLVPGYHVTVTDVTPL